MNAQAAATAAHITQGLTPILAFRSSERAIAFYRDAFGATELFRLTAPDGKIVHAEIKIGKTMLMLADEHPQYNISPETVGRATVVLHLYVENPDAAVDRAVAAGAKCVIPVQDQFYGERAGRVQDPFGYLWILSKHIEDVSPEEMQRRMNAMMQK